MVSMLSQLSPDSASLVVKAASHSIEARVLGVELKKSYHKGVGFKVVETAMPVHVLSILKHGRIMYFLPEHKTLQVSSRITASLCHFCSHTLSIMEESIWTIMLFFFPLNNDVSNH